MARIPNYLGLPLIAARPRDIEAAGSSLLLADYRGYGKSGGRPTEAGL